MVHLARELGPTLFTLFWISALIAVVAIVNRIADQVASVKRARLHRGSHRRNGPPRPRSQDLTGRSWPLMRAVPDHSNFETSNEVDSK
jgi:hypothetical protein